MNPRLKRDLDLEVQVEPQLESVRLAAVLGLLLLHHHLLLRLLHLHHLHHGRLWIHAAHAAVHSHLLLPHLEHLLHAGPLLCHRGAAGAARVAAIVSTGDGSSLRRVVVKVVSTSAPVAESVVAAALGLLLLSHVAAGLRLLDLDRLAVDLEMGAQARIHAGLALEGDEPEAAGSAGVLVHHEGSVHDPAELGEVVLKLLLRGVLADAADEDLACLLLLISGYRSLGVDLHRRHDGINVVSTGKGKG